MLKYDFTSLKDLIKAGMLFYILFLGGISLVIFVIVGKTAFVEMWSFIIPLAFMLFVFTLVTFTVVYYTANTKTANTKTANNKKSRLTLLKIQRGPLFNNIEFAKLSVGIGIFFLIKSIIEYFIGFIHEFSELQLIIGIALTAFGFRKIAYIPEIKKLENELKK